MQGYSVISMIAPCHNQGIRSRVFVLILFSALLFSGCISHERLYYIAPTVTPGIRPEMNTSGFWISQHPYPDRIILNRDQIEEFNASIVNELKSVTDILAHSPFLYGQELKVRLEQSYRNFVEGEHYQANGRLASLRFFLKIRENIDLEGIPKEVKTGHGLIIRYANQRILPVREGLYVERGDLDFDELQNSAMDIGTPLIILHQSLDKNWYFTVSSLSEGWIEVDKVALCTEEDLKEFSKPSEFVVVTEPKANIFLDPLLLKYHGSARMGTKLPLRRRIGKEVLEITLPSKDEDATYAPLLGYLNEKEVHVGYLSYTPRHMIQQAFELLNAPYGWGDTNEEQDCSRFIHEVFSTAGFMLPRNSAAQAQVGRLVGSFDKETSLNEKLEVLSHEGIGGITLLRLKGHIMLFLGMADSRPYVIHEIWGYRQKTWKGDIVRVINRVAVTDLSLGKESNRGSLLERLMTVRTMTKTR